MIEPMTSEEIAWHVKDAFAKSERIESFLLQRALLTWIHAEARAREAEFWEADMPEWSTLEMKHWKSGDWLAQVKAEVGWPRQSE